MNATGRSQASDLAHRLSPLPIQALYSSPLERTRQTAECIAAASGLRLELSDELLEVDFGRWTGTRIDELEASERFCQFNLFRSGTRIPEGELMLEVQQRAVRFLLSLQDVHRGEWIALVSHADVIRAVLCHFLGLAMDLALRLEIAPASVSVLDVGRWNSRLVCLNHTGPLSSELPLAPV